MVTAWSQHGHSMHLWSGVRGSTEVCSSETWVLSHLAADQSRGSDGRVSRTALGRVAQERLPLQVDVGVAPRSCNGVRLTGPLLLLACNWDRDISDFSLVSRVELQGQYRTNALRRLACMCRRQINVLQVIIKGREFAQDK